jgi:hypothetical protein
MNAEQNGIVRNVEEFLIGQRRTRRGHGKVPYPVAKYSQDLANLSVLSLLGVQFSDHRLRDIWDNMFFESIWGSPTVYNFSTVPGLVLDIGCGTGWWVMHMAQRWPVCLSPCPIFSLTCT